MRGPQAQLVLVDELAHTNVPGSRNTKRYEDVQELLAAGIHVITTLNVQHLESLYNTIENLVGVKVRERIPDSVLADADQVINIDISPQDLQKRLEKGKIYPRADRFVAREFFKSGNWNTCESSPSRSWRRRSTRGGANRTRTARRTRPIRSWSASRPRGPNSARLLRFGSRLAGRLNRNWYAVYVQTPSEDPIRIDAMTQRLLADTLTLAISSGAMVFTFKGQDIIDTILHFAREYRVGQIVIGKPHPIPWWRRLLKLEKSVAEELIFRAEGVTITVIDANAEELLTSHLPPAVNSDYESSASAPRIAEKPSIKRLLTEDHIRVWNDPVSKEQLLRELVQAALGPNSPVKVDDVLPKLATREEQGSTFLNEGVALPHARVEGISAPLAALGLTRAGMLDAPTDKPIEAVFLMLSPVDQASSHLQLLAAAGRLLQNRDIRKPLRAAETPAEVVQIIGEQFANK